MNNKKVKYLSQMDGHETLIPQLCQECKITMYRLAKLLKVDVGKIYNLAYGYTSPIYVRGSQVGKMTSVARKICDYFYADVDEIFPRYFCNLELHKLKNIPEHEIYQSWSEQTADPNYALEKVYLSELLEQYKKCKRVSNTDKEIILMYLWKDLSIVEISQRFQLHPFTISSRIKSALHMLNQKLPQFNCDGS